MRNILCLASISAVTALKFHLDHRRNPHAFVSHCEGIIPRKIETSRFLDVNKAKAIKAQFGTPVYVYDEKTLVSQATKALQFPNEYGVTVRYAMKACPNAAILQLFNSMGVHFDASSGYEVRRAIQAGVSPTRISLSSQELPEDFQDLINLGIQFNACSLKQLETFGKLFPNSQCGVRFNPGKGSGGNEKTVGGMDEHICIQYCVFFFPPMSAISSNILASVQSSIILTMK
ncbi:hypothetical protein EON65_28050 [archaeon]|nr:MAG: hypothetical protein EON65_28050 [archaeon]